MKRRIRIRYENVCVYIFTGRKVLEDLQQSGYLFQILIARHSEILIKLIV